MEIPRCNLLPRAKAGRGVPSRISHAFSEAFLRPCAQDSSRTCEGSDSTLKISSAIRGRDGCQFSNLHRQVDVQSRGSARIILPIAATFFEIRYMSGVADSLCRYHSFGIRAIAALPEDFSHDTRIETRLHPQRPATSSCSQRHRQVVLTLRQLVGILFGQRSAPA